MSTTSKERSPAADSQRIRSGVSSAPTTGLLSFNIIRLYMPRLVPLLVYATFLPLLVFVSLGAGYFVWSSLSVSWHVPLYLQYGDGVPPYAHVELPQLMSQQKYAVFVDLQLPATETNLALGNFMTSLTVLSSKNKTLAHVRRPAIVPEPPSRWIYGKPRSIRVKVPLLDSFVTVSSNLAATVEIGRADSWTTIGTGQGREVNIRFASLAGLAVPHGIRGLAVRFPLLSSLAAAATFFLILSFILAMCILPLVRKVQEAPVSIPPDSKIKKEKKRSVSDTGITGRSRRRSGSSHWENRSMVKTEPPEIAMPVTEEPSRILRRRPSRPSMAELES